MLSENSPKSRFHIVCLHNSSEKKDIQSSVILVLISLSTKHTLQDRKCILDLILDVSHDYFDEANFYNRSYVIEQHKRNAFIENISMISTRNKKL